MPVWKVIHTPSLLNSNSMSNPDKIKVENREVMIDGEDIIIAVPAFSASVLTMQQE
jgi:alpha-L-arabinofuranosidase